jgi:hypothetical protein
MRQDIKREKSLLGLFYPAYRRNIKEMIKECPYMKDYLKVMCPEEIVEIEFDLVRGDKLRVYREISYMIKNGWLMISVKGLSRYLAEHSNLADNENYKTRAETIRGYIRRCIVMYK